MEHNQRFYDSIEAPLKTPSRKSSKDSDSLLLKPSPKHRPPHIDVVEQSVGQIGRWQIEIFILMCLITTPTNWVELGIELFAYEADFWCKIPFKDFFLNTSLSQIKNEEICQLQKNINTTFACRYGYHYDLSVVGTTIISEWDLVCDQSYLLSVTQVLIALGTLLGGIIFGVSADRYGRRIVLILSCVMRFFFGLLSSIAPNITVFIVFRFLLAFFSGGVPGIALMMCLEVFGGKWMLIFTVLFQIAFNIGFPLMALVTAWLREWRSAQAVLYALSLLTIFFAWFSPESPRWLLAVGRKGRVVENLEIAAKKNGKDPTAINDLVKDYDDEDQEATEDFCFVMNLFTIRELRKRTILACINGLILFMNIYGFYQMFGEFGKNPLLNLTVQGVTAIIGSLISTLIITKWSRRRTIALTSFIIGICSSLMVVAHSIEILQITLAAILFCCVGIMMSITEPLVGELFPTVLRNSGFGLFSVFVGFGAMIAPLIIALESYYSFLPIAIFSATSFLESGLIMLLPEIDPQDMEETIKDVGS